MEIFHINKLGINVMSKLSSKKLLVIAPEYFSFIKDRIDTLAENFFEINVIVRYYPIAEISRYLPISSLINKRWEYLINPNKTPDNVHIYSAPVYYLPPLIGNFQKLGDMTFQSIKKVIKKNNIAFDIIHAHFIYPDGFIGVKIKSQFKKPLVITGHGYDVYDLPFQNTHWTTVIKDTLNSADAVITVSKSNLRTLKKLHIVPEVRVINNGYSEDLFYPQNLLDCREKLTVALDKKIVLNVGNLELVKGQIFLIDAIEELIKNNPNILCIIVGEGKLHYALDRYIRKKNLQNYVWLVGSINHEEIPLWINAADIFVLPSISEGFGVAQIEALACGKPVIATRNGGSEELIKSPEMGILVNSKDAKKLAHSIEKALNQSWDPDRIRKSVIEYQWRSLIPQICEVYETLL